MSGGPVVYVVDDDEGVRSSLSALFEAEGLTPVACDSGAAFLAAYDGRRGGCIVLDVRLGRASGLDLQAELKARGITAPIIVITGYGSVPTAVRAFKAGASDFLEKPLDPAVLLASVRRALETDQRQRARLLQHDEVQRRLARLTPRERDVMKGLIEGQISKQIASDLELSPRTVEGHRRRILEKMKVGSATELARLVTGSERER